jgi:hypothetical protein
LSSTSKDSRGGKKAGIFEQNLRSIQDAAEIDDYEDGPILVFQPNFNKNQNAWKVSTSTPNSSDDLQTANRAHHNESELNPMPLQEVAYHDPDVKNSHGIFSVAVGLLDFNPLRLNILWCAIVIPIMIGLALRVYINVPSSCHSEALFSSDSIATPRSSRAPSILEATTLDAHNYLRSWEGLVKLLWDEKLAKIAANVVKECPGTRRGHSVVMFDNDNFMTVGINTGIMSGLVMKTIQEWYFEADKYHGFSIETKRVGCALQSCEEKTT